MRKVTFVERVKLDVGRAIVPVTLAPARSAGEAELLPAEPERERLPEVIRISTSGLPTADDRQPAVIETRTARRDTNMVSDVQVPLWQAILTAFALGVMAGLLAWAFSWSWRVPAVVFALAVAVGWLWRLRLADSLLWTVETLTGQDWNGDGRTGKPLPSYLLANPREARSTVATETQTEAQDQERAALLAFLDRCYTSGCAEAAHGVKASGPDRAAYTAKRDVLLSLGIAKWKNPQRPKAGWLLAVSRQRAREILQRHVI